LKIKLIRELTGRELGQELEKTYGSIPELEKLYKENMDNLKLYTDLEDWKYYSENLDEIIEDGKTIITDNLILGQFEMELLDLIKNEKPQSINDLVQMIEGDMRTIYPKISQLEEYGLIELTRGPRKTIVPVVKYDKVEIVG
jgi:hypothetical protein